MVPPPPPPPSVTLVQYCRVPKNGGYSPPAWTVLIFPKSSRFRSYFKRAPRSYFKRARVHVQSCTCTCTYAHVMSYYTYRCVMHALHQNSFLTHFSSLRTFLNFGEIPAWPFFGKPFFGTRQYCTVPHLLTQCFPHIPSRGGGGG